MDSDFLDTLVKFNAQASGRDKLFRLLQYSSKFSWWYLSKAGLSPDLVIKLQKLSSSLSTTRKFLRLGKSVDFIHGALNSIHLVDKVYRFSLTLSKLNQSLFLLFDHIIWAGRVGLASINNDKWNHLSARFWLVTIVLNLFRDCYEICLIITQELKLRASKAAKSHYKNGASNHKQTRRPGLTNVQLISKCVGENKPVFLDLSRNLCDLVLPLEALGYLKASPGIQGLVGTLSSLIGIATAWNPLLRVVPS